MVLRICAALSESLIGAPRGVRHWGHLCEHKQHFSHCGHVFRMSYPHCRWKEPVLVAVTWCWGWRTSIFVPAVTVSGTLLVLALTIHMVHDILGHWKITYWCTTEHLHVPFYSDILWDFHINLEENLLQREQDHWRTIMLLQKDIAV
jgi:hypothetical protein